MLNTFILQVFINFLNIFQYSLTLTQIKLQINILLMGLLLEYELSTCR
jgi:hypothetical protein